jgi:hypothetical protein
MAGKVSKANEERAAQIETNLMDWYREERERVEQKARWDDPVVAARANATIAMIDGMLAGKIEPVRPPARPMTEREMRIKFQRPLPPTRPVISARQKA